MLIFSTHRSNYFWLAFLPFVPPLFPPLPESSCPPSRPGRFDPNLRKNLPPIPRFSCAKMPFHHLVPSPSKKSCDAVFVFRSTCLFLVPGLIFFFVLSPVGLLALFAVPKNPIQRLAFGKPGPSPCHPPRGYPFVNNCPPALGCFADTPIFSGFFLRLCPPPLRRFPSLL